MPSKLDEELFKFVLENDITQPDGKRYKKEETSFIFTGDLEKLTPEQREKNFFLYLDTETGTRILYCYGARILKAVKRLFGAVKAAVEIFGFYPTKMTSTPEESQICGPFHLQIINFHPPEVSDKASREAFAKYFFVFTRSPTAVLSALTLMKRQFRLLKAFDQIYDQSKSSSLFEEFSKMANPPLEDKEVQDFQNPPPLKKRRFRQNLNGKSSEEHEESEGEETPQTPFSPTPGQGKQRGRPKKQKTQEGSSLSPPPAPRLPEESQPPTQPRESIVLDPNRKLREIQWLDFLYSSLVPVRDRHD